jgi:plasmid rolling circle replication initiator protein Rep
MEQVSEFLPDEYFDDIKQKIKYNDVISKLYEESAYLAHQASEREFFDNSEPLIDPDGVLTNQRIEWGYNPEEAILDSQAVSLHKKGLRVSSCLGSWISDYYRFQSVKDIQRVVLCKDKFCYNCQAMLAQKRYQKYVPHLQKLSNDFQLLHIVFTVPNPSGALLSSTVNQMYKAFPHLIRFFKGNAIVSGVDFEKYGYQGAIRAFEVTRNVSDETYHPHFHCIFVFSKRYDFTQGKNINKYSYDQKTKNKVPFTDFDILIQKLWFLVFNKMPVTKYNLDTLDVGYDCLSMPAANYLHECFKYATKGVFKSGTFDTVNYDSLRVFEELQPVLDRRRLIQGYGCLHGFVDSDIELLEEDFTAWYQSKVEELQTIEKPIEVKDTFDQVYNSKGSIHYMSKFNLKKTFILQRELEKKGDNDV